MNRDSLKFTGTAPLQHVLTLDQLVYRKIEFRAVTPVTQSSPGRIRPGP